MSAPSRPLGLLQSSGRTISGLIAALIVLVGVIAATPAMAEPPAKVSGKVSKIVVEGSRRIGDAVVLEAMALHQGENLTTEKIRRDIKAIHATGFYDDVQVLVDNGPDGVVVTFVVKEKPAIREVRLEGNKKIDDDDVKEVMDLQAFQVLNEATLKKNVQKVKDLYVEKGYYLAEIEPEIVPLADEQVEVVFKIRENRKVIVQRIEFTGNEHLPAGKIKRFMRLKEGGFAPWLTSSGAFRRDYLETDRQTVQAVFLEEGYVDARVDPPKVYLSPDKRFVFISYHIEEGPRYKIGAISVDGDFVDAEGLTKDNVLDIISGRGVQDLQEELWRRSTGKGMNPLLFGHGGPKLRPADWFKYSTVSSVLGTIQEFYADQGYAFSNVVPMTETNKEGATVDIDFQISKGEKVKIGRINISGNDPTFDKIVRREIQINEGETYRGSLIRASRARLERLGYFESVDISTPRGEGDDVLDLNVQVSEQPTGSFSVGLGYSNLENFVLNANVSKNNFLGLGYTMSAAVNWSSLRRQFNVSFFDPYFLDSRWTFSVDAYSQSQQFVGSGQATNSFLGQGTGLNQYQRGGSVSFGRYLDRRDDMLMRLEYTVEDVGLTSLDPYRQRLLGGDLFRSGLTSQLGLSLSIDKRNNRIFATQGVFFTASSTLAGGFRINDQEVASILGGKFNFIENKVNLRFYQPLVPNTDLFVVRFNSSFGQIMSTDGRPVPFIHRYRAGGIQSVRGYQWYSLGPTIRGVTSEDPVRGDDLVVVGGDITWVNNLEVETPIIRAAGISGVVFFDAGNAFVDPWGGSPLSISGLRSAVGFGVRWRSPMGPMRFEWGIPLKPFPDERKVVFDFGIGSFF